MKFETVRKRYTFKKEIVELLEKESKKVKKTESEFLEDLIYKNSHERDNRLSNHIARDSENLILLQILNKGKQYSSIEEIYKDVNVINNDKKIYLSEKRNKEVGFFKEVKSIFNFDNFKNIHNDYNQAKDDKSKKIVLEKAFNKFLSIVKKYENK
ncbi:hypothetical protein [Sulfurimonas paralvinellae]|uniref:Uncharacterized protein n=1 Tax=Sulfurimonas paralvinellae TaxID=317658 RepID=A0A7M1BBY1_9BACT|nr:hypothetical protein [Sulfurimonas paralvinellae]QOP46292.1 hypothetical protein FM071_08305 [Sulfurimonas paralvinellae]